MPIQRTGITPGLTCNLVGWQETLARRAHVSKAASVTLAALQVSVNRAGGGFFNKNWDTMSGRAAKLKQPLSLSHPTLSVGQLGW